MILDREYPPDIRVENEIESLTEQGHELHIACYSRKGRKSKESYNGHTIHRKKISPFIFKSSVGCLKFPFYFNFWRKFIGELMREYSFDAIHVHDLPLAAVGHETGKKHNIPFVLDLHENWPAYLEISTHTNSLAGRLLSSNEQWVAYEKKYTIAANRVIVVVDEARERLIRLGCQPDKVVVVSNTLNLKEVTNLQHEPDPDYVTLFYGGGINYHRGLQTVIEAMPEIIAKQDKVRLWIVGDGSYKANLEAEAEKQGVTSNVRFFGYKPFKEMLDLLAQSDLALIPHLVSEHTNSTIPHKLFQYMYYGKPVISSNCEPIRRILEETGTGICYENKDELARIILSLVEDPEKYKALSAEGKTWVSNKYNWEYDRKRLHDIYATFEKEGKSGK